MTELQQNPELFFDEESHTYYLRGRKIPGVTRVLNEFVLADVFGTPVYVSTINGTVIPAPIMEAAADLGKAVHRVQELILLHGIDSVYYPPEVEPAVQALVQWQKDHSPQIIAVEHRGVSVKHGYAGTLDILAYLPKKKRLGLIDVKTGVGFLTGPQTAAYEQMWREETKERAAIDRYKLQLPKGGEAKYSFTQLKNVNDWVFFTHKLFAHSFLKTI